MPSEPHAIRSPRSLGEVLADVERLEVVPEAQLQKLRDEAESESGSVDPAVLTERLVGEGLLTDFQARRLLVGKADNLFYGRYLLLSLVGTGAMGRVFKARHQLMNRVVALKAVLPICVTSKNAVPRFFREMKIVGLLDHPNVVRAYDADLHRDTPFIVMEFLEGEDLEHILNRRGMLPADEVIDYMMQAALGLAHAHEKGVVHRDVKPTNLFRTKSGVVKLLDLGLGSFVGVSNAAVEPLDTDEGFVVGTTDYMSPEQVTVEPVDARTDLFSLGCSMYRLLTGSYAFPGETKADRLVRRIRDPYVPITTLRPDLSPRLVKVLDRLLALKADDRFSCAEEAAEALDSLSSFASRAERKARDGAGPGSEAKRAAARAAAAAPEPAAPLNWSLIESSLRAPGERPRIQEVAAPPREARASASPQPSSSSGHLQRHRRSLEEEGEESGRTVHHEYRKQLIEMKRSLADEGEEPSEEPPSLAAGWLERVGEHLGDFLAEPSALHILMALTVVMLIFGFALAYVAS